MKIEYEKHKDKRIDYCNKRMAVHKLIKKKYCIRYFFMDAVQKYRFRCKLMGVIPDNELVVLNAKGVQNE